MIVNCPGVVKAGVVKAGVVSDELVDLSDVFATLAEFSGASPPAGHVVDGKSFAPILRGESGKGREWIFSAIRNERMLRDKRWLLEGRRPILRLRRQARSRGLSRRDRLQGRRSRRRAAAV